MAKINYQSILFLLNYNYHKIIPLYTLALREFSLKWSSNFNERAKFYVVSKSIDIPVERIAATKWPPGVISNYLILKPQT